MHVKPRTMPAAAGAVVVAAAAVLGTATPALAKSDTQLSGPRVAHARHAFLLTVSVDDDGGARAVSARLQLRGAHGRYQWFGTPHRLRLKNRWNESYAFTVTENHPAVVTFRAVVGGGYAVTSPVTVVIR